MNTLSKAAVFTALLSSTSVFASTYYELGEEANDALAGLSEHCVEALLKVKLKEGNSWIGSSAKWYNQNNNYGYNFDVFYRLGFSTEKLATIHLTGKYIPNPPADASSYKYSCSVSWEK
ncbi:hypothetical protein H0A36_24880 [Endozoicomonas sp. SM1973]|uniref:Uncharacterized protein n=1 Tax=Spartinivicinus marinus TaxID=2994442 RepID=A0A853IFE5_9GAMM|nr:hypothetical protein [Spartinivicinus marinus]MCX4027700.1 hypothetical protein [Spartinivicinus marinus]NYZ69258.1 hypothetical protein [Spartinivicinus marinus]